MSNPLDQQFDSRQYDFDYFASSQTMIFIGDIWLDDAVRIGYNERELVKPYFGAHSRHFDTIVGGPVLVEGSLAINFKEKAYLPIILQEYRNRGSVGSSVSPIAAGTSLGYQTANQSGKQAPIDLPVNIERALRLQSGGQLAAAEDTVLNSLHWNDDTQFEKEAERLEDLLWASSSLVADHSILDQPLVPIPFSIYLLFGDYSKEATNAVNHTAVKIEDCVLAGKGQTIEISGEPVYQVYNFVARRMK